MRTICKPCPRTNLRAPLKQMIGVSLLILIASGCSDDDEYAVAPAPPAPPQTEAVSKDANEKNATDKASKADDKKPETDKAPEAPVEEKKYALRGELLPVGTSLSSTFEAKILRAKSTLAASQLLNGTYSYRHKKKSEFEISQVDSNGNPTKITESIFTNRKQATIDFGSTNDKADWNGPLQGEVVNHIFKDGTWTSSLYQKEPNADQREFLKRVFVPTDELFPISKVSIGEQWKVKQSKLHLLVDTEPGDKVTGEVTLRLDKVEKEGDMNVAYISGQGQLKATSKDGAETQYKISGALTRPLNPGYLSSMEWKGKYDEKYLHSMKDGTKGTMFTEGQIELVWKTVR